MNIKSIVYPLILGAILFTAAFWFVSILENADVKHIMALVLGMIGGLTVAEFHLALRDD